MPNSCSKGFHRIPENSTEFQRTPQNSREWSVFLNSKPISNFLGHLYGFLWFFLSTIYWSSLYHDLMARLWEKVISILAGNLNSSRCYLITTVQKFFKHYFLNKMQLASFYVRHTPHRALLCQFSCNTT